MKKLTIGILAHVDAGKTTLSEAMLYTTGQLKKLGRVDHKNSFLDTHNLERARGITIFSKQARLRTKDMEIILLDTPGHMDFSAETERTMQVLDYAILVISGTDGVQAHTEALWRLLRRYHVPTFLFVNKMDLAGCDPNAVLSGLKKKLSENCVNFSDSADKIAENAALCDEILLEEYLASGSVSEAALAGLVKCEGLFPCFFGSALKLRGVEEFLSGLNRMTLSPVYPKEFAARVYKIAREAQGNRLTYLKITGGSLPVRASLTYTLPGGENLQEKVKEIRLYSGAKFETAESTAAGEVCALLGLTKTYPGQNLGGEALGLTPMLEPVMTYRLRLPQGCDPARMLPKLLELQEEDPQLHIVWNDRLKEISAQLMGQVQIEILKSLVLERFDTPIEVDAGRILYKETIASPVEGVGHFEPLRHYAEVHLLLEPLPRGAGLVFDAKCSEDVLDRSWQRLILTHLEEKTHLGVKTGAPITDMKITLMSGRAHLKHTEGGDFRQATYRAVRQGLMQAETVLLEPVYAFQLGVPAAQLGRAIGDIRAMSGDFSQPVEEGELMVISGTAPVSEMSDYAAQVVAYTRGRGYLRCAPGGFAPCHNPEAVMEAEAYDPESDLDNTPDSVFCAHGAGFTVKWRDVPEYMHLESCLRPKKADAPILRHQNFSLDDRELEAIMEREFGPIRRPQYQVPRQPAPQNAVPAPPPRRNVLIVDGYNIIFAWDDLAELAREDLEAARKELMERLAAYCAYKRQEVILVFDGYKVKGGNGERFRFHDLLVVYTKENQTGDMYIEALVAGIGKNDRVRVATSDGLIQLSALRSGVLRMSAGELLLEVNAARQEMSALLRDLAQKQQNSANVTIGESLGSQNTGKERS